MSAMKTPGVYIVEKSAFPNSVVEASTAIPAFVGYTQFAKNGNKSLIKKPFKISSLSEFEQYFGGAPKPIFNVRKDPAAIMSNVFIDNFSILKSLKFLEQEYISLNQLLPLNGLNLFANSIKHFNFDLNKDKNGFEYSDKIIIDRIKIRIKFSDSELKSLLKIEDKKVKGIGVFNGFNSTAVFDEKNFLETLNKDLSEHISALGITQTFSSLSEADVDIANSTFLNPSRKIFVDSSFELVIEDKKVVELLEFQLDTATKNIVVKGLGVLTGFTFPIATMSEGTPNGVGTEDFNQDSFKSALIDFVKELKLISSLSVNGSNEIKYLNEQEFGIARNKLKKFSQHIISFVDSVNAIVESSDTDKLLSSDKLLLFADSGVKEVFYAIDLTSIFKDNILKYSSPLNNNVFYNLERIDPFNLYYNLRLFFANGGSNCYIVSVGNYSDDKLSKEKLIEGIVALEEEQEPTLLVIPEAVNLAEPQQCFDVQAAMLSHCGNVMRNRFAIFDIYRGYVDRKDPAGDVILNFRDKIGTENLDFAAAYYPFLNTSIVSDSELSMRNFANSWKEVKELLFIDSIHLHSYIKELDPLVLDLKDNKYVDPNKLATLDKLFSQQSAMYKNLLVEMREKLNVLPPSAAMAGIYTLTDGTKEVWKAPANVGVSSVISPTVSISNANQEDLNVPNNGKAVNAIRYFVGDGIKVWGARTLDGNSLDWRYVNVRRTMIMLEESIKNAAKAYVFEPNTANTWVSVRSMISSFLNGIWKRGGLAGAIPDDAYSVHIGLGETMTPEDILEGKMKITILVALVRPAEFIEITFQQQMQKS